MEQSFRGRNSQHGGSLRTAAGLAEDHHLGWIAAEVLDIVTDPFERGDQVHHADHAGMRELCRSSEIGQVEIAEAREAVVNRDYNNITQPRELRAIILGAIAGPGSESADVPVIISNTLEDAALRLTNFDLTEEGLRTMMNQRYGAKAEEMLAMYRNRYPDKSPFLIQAQIDTDSTSRRSATLQAERKASLGKAPAYMYLWTFASTGFGGKFGAVHGTDVSATFNNYRDGVGGTGSEEERALWARFATTWVTMAKNANPNNSKIPNWPGYDAEKRPTMLCDKEIRVENDPRSEIRKFWAEMPARA